MMSSSDDYLEKRRATRKERMGRLANFSNPKIIKTSVGKGKMRPEATPSLFPDTVPNRNTFASNPIDEREKPCNKKEQAEKITLSLAHLEEEEEEHQGEVRPGAMWIEGYAASPEDNENFNDIEATSNEIENTKLPSLLVEARLVEEDQKGVSEQERIRIEAETRQRILGNAVHAEVIHQIDEKEESSEKGNANQKRGRWMIVACFFIILANTVGVLVWLTNRNNVPIMSTNEPTLQASTSPSSAPLTIAQSISPSLNAPTIQETDNFGKAEITASYEEEPTNVCSNNDAHCWQSFTATTTGVLTKISVPICNTENNPRGTINLYEGDACVLSKNCVDGTQTGLLGISGRGPADECDLSTLSDFTFDPPIPMVAGRVYSFQVKDVTAYTRLSPPLYAGGFSYHSLNIDIDGDVPFQAFVSQINE